MSDRKMPDSSRERLPILLLAIGVGVVLIASGVAVRAGQGASVDQAEVTLTISPQVPGTTAAPTEVVAEVDTPTQTAEPIEPAPTEETETDTSVDTLEPTDEPPTATPGSTDTSEPPTETPTDVPPGTTPLPTPVPTRRVNTGSFAGPEVTPVTQVPPPAEQIAVPRGVLNVLLLGADRRAGVGGAFLTDTIIVVSVDMNEGTVNMLSFPRDMSVYVPGWTVTKINRVFQHGESVGWDGGGFGLLQETLLYNFGIEVGHYALVDLGGFSSIINALGGIEVPVDCQLQFYALKEPRRTVWDFATYDEWVAYTAPDSGNWELYTLPVGVHDLDGHLAERYARHRYGTSDFDRAFRQQQVLRAIANRAKDNGFLNLTRIPALWREYNELVETSMDLGNMLQFAPIAADLDGIEIHSYVLTPDMLTAWADPVLNQTAYAPNPEALSFVEQAMKPPSQNYVTNNTVSVEVRNGTNSPRLDEVAADRLIWNGIDAVATGYADSQTYDTTIIYDYTGRNKTSQLIWMQRNLHVNNSEVIVQPDPNRIFDYVVILGSDYSSCSRAPQAELAPVPTRAPEVTPTPDDEQTTPEGEDSP